MRKKYLSALLFGALLFASAGTFTSCKDYDDDINNLQTQVTDVKNAVAELQKLIGDGKFVTNIVSENNGLKITWNDGQSTVIENVINEENQEVTPGDVVTFDEVTGEILINGKGSGYYTSKKQLVEEDAQLPYVNDNGYLVIFDETGKEVTTDIKASPVTAVKNEDGSYTLTIWANGSKQTVEVPSAASSLTSITIAGDDNTPIALKMTGTKFDLADNNEIRKNWNGAKSLPEQGTYIGRNNGSEDLKIRVNPVNVDASLVTFKLTNSKDEDLSGVTLSATAENKVLDTPDGRAADKGGLYKMSLNDVILEDEDAWDELVDDFGNTVFALNPNSSVRSAYRITVARNTSILTSLNLQLKTGSNNITPTSGNGEETTPYVVELDKGSKYTFSDGGNSLYDLMMTVDTEALNNYKIELDPKTYSFTLGKDIDVSTSGEFAMTVTVINVDGSIVKKYYKIKLTDKISDTTSYEEVPYAVTSNDKVFGIDLSTMKNGMTAEELNTWKTRVDFSKTKYTLWEKVQNGDVAGTEYTSSAITTNKLLTPYVTKTIDKNAKANVSSKDEANYISIKVDDSKANADIKLFTTYYLKVTFNSSNGELNSIIVPVKFTAPTVAEQFSVKSGLEKDGVIYGFLSEKTANNSNPAYTISNAFDDFDSKATISVTDDLIDDMNNVKSSAKFSINEGKVQFKDAVPTQADKTQDAYGKAFTLEATNAKYSNTNWVYPDKAEYTDYVFKMKLLSPIFDGTFSTSTGDALSIIGGSDFKIENSQLSAVDYNGTKFNILPDKADENPANQAFTDSRIASVSVANVPGQISEAEIVAAKEDNNGVVTEGYIKGKAASVVTDTETINLTVTVKDIFGYQKTVKIPVIIKSNK